MASSNRPHTPGTGAGVRVSQSESNYISWTWDHLFFQENGAASQVSVNLGFCSSFNTALCSVIRFWGQTSQKAGLCTETEGTAAACQGSAWRQLPPSPLELVWATQLKLSALATVVHRLSTFPLLFQILNFQITEKKSSCSHETSTPASIQDRCFWKCTRVFCPLLLQRNQDLELLPFPLVWQTYQQPHFWHFPTSSSVTQKKRRAIVHEHQKLRSI